MRNVRQIIIVGYFLVPAINAFHQDNKKRLLVGFSPYRHNQRPSFLASFFNMTALALLFFVYLLAHSLIS